MMMLCIGNMKSTVPICFGSIVEYGEAEDLVGMLLLPWTRRVQLRPASRFTRARGWRSTRCSARSTARRGSARSIGVVVISRGSTPSLVGSDTMQLDGFASAMNQ